MTPVDGVSVVPGGIAPLRIDHVNGLTPPVSVIVCVKPDPTVDPLELPQLAVNLAVMMIEQEIGAATLPAESVAVSEKVKVPVAVGMPDNTPVAGLSVSPVGKLPDVSAQVTAPTPPIDVNVCAYAPPSDPL